MEEKGYDFVRVRAHGKINLGLDVIGKREDGYHNVRMIMQQVGLYDGIDIKRLGLCTDGKRYIDIETNLRYLPVNENNLAYKAAALLMDEFDIQESIHIKIKKLIPVAAGMAGGSSDAAAVMKGLNRMFGLRLSKKELMERGVKLGADVPYCIMGGTALAEGIGDILTPVRDIPPCYIILAKPGINVSTRVVYSELNVDKIEHHPDIDGLIRGIQINDLYAMTKKMGNVLEEVTEKMYPVIKEIKQTMLSLGAINSMMSGSGPTVFGIFDEKDTAKQAYDSLKADERCRQVYITDGGLSNERYQFKYQ
ncbi:MAG: 4-(cytidine 5'-diphospho)-2-C-methyl-D-erythritol kinase [Lachnospiraceae bacterium]|nr:4-(cytidine 5'-diphospho)-2-C-methyl-D-erythritol kinase [Lachnospiraceae bacterium]